MGGYEEGEIDTGQTGIIERQHLEDYRRKIRFKQVKFAIVVLAWQMSIVIVLSMLLWEYSSDLVPMGGAKGTLAGTLGQDHNIPHGVCFYFLWLALSTPLHGWFCPNRSSSLFCDRLPGVPVRLGHQSLHRHGCQRTEASIQSS